MEPCHSEPLSLPHLEAYHCHQLDLLLGGPLLRREPGPEEGYRMPSGCTARGFAVTLGLRVLSPSLEFEKNRELQSEEQEPILPQTLKSRAATGLHSG